MIIMMSKECHISDCDWTCNTKCQSTVFNPGPTLAEVTGPWLKQPGLCSLCNAGQCLFVMVLLSEQALGTANTTSLPTMISESLLVCVQAFGLSCELARMTWARQYSCTF